MKKETASLSGLKREISELTVLYEVSKAINTCVKLEDVMNAIMSLLHEKMGMERGTLTLLDVKTKELIIEIAHGLEQNEKARGRYRGRTYRGPERRE